MRIIAIELENCRPLDLALEDLMGIVARQSSNKLLKYKNEKFYACASTPGDAL